KKSHTLSMDLTIKKPLAEKPPYSQIAMAYGRSILAGGKLPPGDFSHLDVLEREQRDLLLKRSAALGPIFKGLIENRLAVCVIGNAIGQRVLRTNSRALRPVSIELNTLFPQGFMRQMEGDCHRKYRSLLAQGINDFDVTALAPQFERIVSNALDGFADQKKSDAYQWSATLSKITTDFLLLLFFGVSPGGRTQEQLRLAYNNLGPNGVVWYIKDRQVSAFAALREEIQGLLTNTEQHSSPGLVQKMAGSGAVDETMLGNLIYMVELGRYDLRGLFRWIAKYAAENTVWLDKIAAEEDRDGSLAEAFVLEVLRMDQSERLMRNVIEDFSFEGFFIPRGALLRIGMWEAHKDSQNFPDPFHFDPGRHLSHERLGERFSPFGLDHHHCPFATLSIRLASLFLRVLARDYKISMPGGDFAVRGAYHWEPSPDFTINLQPLAAIRHGR
ncbi:MAG: cytochrome P450, partial [Halioglobus sp.]